MTQYSRPESDTSPGGWTPTPLYLNIDEVTADTTYISGTSRANDTAVMTLSGVFDPVSSSGHIMRCRAYETAGITLDFVLKCGTTTITTWRPALTTTGADYSYTLSAAEADAITNYSNLSLTLIQTYSSGTGTRRAYVSWFVLEVPDSPTQQYPQPVGGSITASGGISRTANKGVGGIVTGAGGLARSVLMALAGAITAFGDLATQKTQYIVTRSLYIQVNKAATGSVTPTGSVIKRAFKALAGTINLYGLLEALRTAGMFVQAVGGSITASGGMARRIVYKGVSGSVTGVGVAIKRATRSVAGSLTASGTAIKSARKFVSGSVTASGALLKGARKTVAGTITTTGTLIRGVSKRVSGSVTASGVVSRSKAVLLALSGSLTPSGAVSRRVAKLLGGSVALSGAVARAAIYRRLLSGTITAAGALNSFRETLLGLPPAPLLPWGIRAVDWLLAPLVAAISALTELVAPTVPGAHQGEPPNAVSSSGSVATMLPAAPGTPIIDARQDLQAPTVVPLDGVEHVEPPDVNGVQKL